MFSKPLSSFEQKHFSKWARGSFLFWNELQILRKTWKTSSARNNEKARKSCNHGPENDKQKFNWTRRRSENQRSPKVKCHVYIEEIQMCTTDLASYSLTQWQFWQLTLKWLPGARAQDKNKQCYYCFLFFLFLFNYTIQGKLITWLVNSALNCTWKLITHSSLCVSCDIGFRVQFNANSLVRQWIFLQNLKAPEQLY